MQPPSLRSVTQTTIIRTLVCRPVDCRYRQLMLELFKTRECGFSEDILLFVMEMFPHELTDELLVVLAPPHLKGLKLKDCSALTCDGLVKTITKCCHLNYLDFSGCVNLLRPVVYSCLKDNAPKLTQLSFEDCELITDDVVQIILMCCPGLEHLNISSCKNITDKAFALSSPPKETTSCTYPPKLSQRALLAGRNLSSVDLSGCQSLTSAAVRSLVALCGPSLVSVNIAWTGVGCIALLYLAGLSPKDVLQFVREVDPSCSKLLEDENTVNNPASPPEHLSQTRENGNKEDYIFQDSTDGCINVKQSSSLNGASNDNNIHVNVLDNFIETTEESLTKSTFLANTSESVDVRTDSIDTERSLLIPKNECKSIEEVKGSVPQEDLKKVLKKVPSNLDYDHVGAKKYGIFQSELCGSPLGQNIREAKDTNFNKSDGHFNTAPQKCSIGKMSIDEEWMLAWQQIGDGDSCSDNDELFDCMWDDAALGVDSASSAFGDAISCLTSALVNLDSSDGDDDDNENVRADSNGIDDGGQTLMNDPSVLNAEGTNPDAVVAEDVDVDENSVVDDGNTLINDDDDNDDADDDYKNDKSCRDDKELEESLDDADELFADILNLKEMRTEDKSYTLYVFSDGLTSLTNAMMDLISRYDDDHDGDSDGDNDGDNGNDDDDLTNLFKVNATPITIDSKGYQQYNNSAHFCQSDDDVISGEVDKLSRDIGVTPESHGFFVDDPGINMNKIGNSDYITKVPNLKPLTMEQINLTIIPLDDEQPKPASVPENTASENSTQSALSERRDTTARSDSVTLGASCSHTTECNTTLQDDENSTQSASREERDTTAGSDSVTLGPSCSHTTGCNATLQDKEITPEINVNKSDQEITGHGVLTLSYKPRLRVLDLSNIYFHSTVLGMACLKFFTSVNRTLTSFAASWSELDDDTLVAMVTNESELRSLTLIDCENITSRSLISLPVHCPLLESLDLKGVSYMTDQGVVPMLASPCLKTLSLAEAAVTDISMIALAETCGERIHDLDLSWCEELTDRGMCAVARSCPELNSLALRQCAASSVTIATLSSYCHAMTSLNVAGVDHLTDQMVVTMATNMSNLTFIDLSWNPGVTSTGVGALLLHCRRLEEAGLSGLKVLTSKPFLAIIGDLPRWRLKQEIMLRTIIKCQQNGDPLVTYIKPCDTEMAKTLGDELPFRSTTYSPALRRVVLEYSDKVNDDHLAQVVAVCRGTLGVRDYYGQPIEPKWVFL